MTGDERLARTFSASSLASPVEERPVMGASLDALNDLLAGFLRAYKSPATGGSFLTTMGEGFLNLVRDSQRLSGRRPELTQIGQATKLTIYAAAYDGEDDFRLTETPQTAAPPGRVLARRHARLEEETAMGVVNANVVISNPADRAKSWEGRFLVDTGATNSLVPRQHLQAIGLAPEAQRTYILADGSEVRMDVAVARIELLGEIVGGTVLFGAADAEPLLGVTALESLGIEVDPLNQQLKKLPAVRLKNRSGSAERSDRRKSCTPP